MSTVSKFARALALFSAEHDIAALPDMRVADRTYCILFTPRSGSTWLTYNIAKYRLLSHPDEYFIANEFLTSLEYNQASNIRDYYRLVSNKMMTNVGTFGFEISFFDLEELEKDALLRSLMEGVQSFVYLSRKNFVAQAVSLYIASVSGRYHSFEGDRVQSCVEPVKCDLSLIKFWACHILQQEYGIERWLSHNRIDALRITFEDILADCEAVVASIARWIGVELTIAPDPAAKRTRSVSTNLNAHFEAAFRAEHPEWCEYWSRNRGMFPCDYDGFSPI